MLKKEKIKWVETARRGKAQPLLVLDPLIEAYRLDYFKKAHQIKWSPKNYRQFDNARWFSVKDFENYRSLIEKATRSKKINLFTYAKEYSKRIIASRKFADKYRNLDFKILTNEKLARIFSMWFEETKRMWCFAYDYIFLNQFLPDIITSIVASKVPDIWEQNEILGILFEADESSEMRLEKRALIKIAQHLRKNKSKISNSLIEKRLESHLDKFAHLGFYYFRGASYTQKDLRDRLAEYLRLSPTNFKKMIADFRKQDRNEVLMKKITKKLGLSNQTILQIKYIKRWGSLSNHVDETFGYVVHHLMPMWLEIAKRLKVPYNYFYSLTGDEIITGLEKGELAGKLREEAKIRHNSHAFILENGKKRILIEKQLKEYTKKELQGETKILNTNKLKGQAASAGKVKGIAKLVFSIHDVRRVERGNILVASSTNPTYVPAMERAGAIVTDEGGLLSHAAIVSRELKVPCVVGTKVATRVLKDGDLVEVDANKGVIKIIKKNS